MPKEEKVDALLFGGENRFIRSLRQLRGQDVEICLGSGIIINGKLIEVFSDHLFIEAHRGQYRVRLLTIEYVRA